MNIKGFDVGLITSAIKQIITEHQLSQKCDEDRKTWINRIDKFLTNEFICVEPIELMKNIKLFDNYTIIILKSLFDIAEDEKNEEFLEMLKSWKDTYVENKIHTNISAIRVIDYIVHPGRQADAREGMYSIFIAVWFALHQYGTVGKFPNPETDEKIFKKWFKCIREPKTSPLRLYVDTEKEILNRYEYLKDAVSGETRCNVPFPCKGGACTRKKGHSGPHVIRLPLFGISAVWEDL